MRTNSRIIVRAITLFSIFLSLCFVNPTKEVEALTDVFSMNGILQSNNIQSSLPLTDVFSMNGILQSNNIQSLSLEDNVITCIGLICDGTNNDDIIIGSFLNEKISGLKGDDVIQGNNGDDIIYGGEGSDSIQGGEGIDNIFGQDGDDFIYADGSTSLASSQIGDEIAIVNRFNDWLLGVENLNFVTINDISTNVNSVSDVFTMSDISTNDISISDVFTMSDISTNDISISDVFISLNSNMLLFSESYLDGGNGDDHIFGGSLNDVLKGGPGDDYFDCNEGVDRVLDFDPDEDTANVNCESLE